MPINPNNLRSQPGVVINGTALILDMLLPGGLEPDDMVLLLVVGTYTGAGVSVVGSPTISVDGGAVWQVIERDAIVVEPGAGLIYGAFYAFDVPPAALIRFASAPNADNVPFIWSASALVLKGVDPADPIDGTFVFGSNADPSVIDYADYPGAPAGASALYGIAAGFTDAGVHALLPADVELATAAGSASTSTISATALGIAASPDGNFPARQSGGIPAAGGLGFTPRPLGFLGVLTPLARTGVVFLSTDGAVMVAPAQ